LKRFGGITIVQQPNEARFEEMPRSAMEYLKVNHALPSTEIGSLLGRLVAESRPAAKAAKHAEDKARMKNIPIVRSQRELAGQSRDPMEYRRRLLIHRRLSIKETSTKRATTVRGPNAPSSIRGNRTQS
jgi:hypothetical protein